MKPRNSSECQSVSVAAAAPRVAAPPETQWARHQGENYFFVNKVQIRGCNISGLARAQCRRAEPNRAQTEPNRARHRGDHRDEPPARKLPSPAGRLSAGSQATEATLLTNMSPLTSSERAGAKTAIQRKRRLPATLQLPPLILPQLSGSSPL